MQLNRLLAGNPDKAANLRVVRNLAAKYPQLPQAHFAVAQAAAIAGDDDAALAAARQAQKLQPGLGARGAARGAGAAEALARRGGEAARRVRREVSAARARRGSATRACWCSTSACPRRASSSRPWPTANPKNPEVIYAVGLLAYPAEGLSAPPRTT